MPRKKHQPEEIVPKLRQVDVLLSQGRVGSDAREADPEAGRIGKLVSPARRRRCIDHTVRKFGVPERLACRILGQHRSTQRKAPKGRADDAALTADIIELATRYGRYGYRRIAALLREAGWLVNVAKSSGSDGRKVWRCRPDSPSVVGSG